jgi:hypothetical protein
MNMPQKVKPMIASPLITLPCRHLGIAVPRLAAAVYAWLADPAHWVQWASGLGALRQLDDGRWVAEQPEGLMTVVFSPRNPFGILDHTVTMPSQNGMAGAEIYVPMRVIANADGAEVVLTLFRQPGVDDEKFATDAEWVMRDLERLKLQTLHTLDRVQG